MNKYKYVETEFICLVCRAMPGGNDIGLCDTHYFQYIVMCAAGRRLEFLQELDKEGLIGKVGHRQQYKYVSADLYNGIP